MKKTKKPVLQDDMEQDPELEDGIEEQEELDENQEDLEDPDKDMGDDEESEEELEVDWKEAAKRLKAALEDYSIEGYPNRMKALKLRPKYNDKEQRTPALYDEIMAL